MDETRHSPRQTPSPKRKIFPFLLLVFAIVVLVLSVEHFFVRKTPELTLSDRLPLPVEPAEKDLVFDELYLTLRDLDVNLGQKIYESCGSTTNWKLQSESCRAFLPKVDEIIGKFDQGIRDVKGFSLARPENLEKRGRIPFFHREIRDDQKLDKLWYEISKVQLLYIYLTLKTLDSFSSGDKAQGSKYLKYLVQLPSFFQQNPTSFRHHQIGLALQEHLAELMVYNLRPENLERSMVQWIPTPEEILSSLEVGLSSAWVIQKEYAVDRMKKRFQKSIGDFYTFFFSPEAYQEILGEWILCYQGTYRNASKLGEEHRKKCDEMPPPVTVWSRITNYMGRVSLREFIPVLKNHNTIQTIDLLQGAKIVIAARLFEADHGRGPGTQDDLVPEYLDAWPVGLLDGRPIRWLAQKKGVYILDEDGMSRCGRRKLCNLPFKPLAPIEP